jgi:uncharacterized membrane protein
MAMMTPKIVTYADATIQQPRADVRWPASAIWRPGEPAVRSIGLSDLKEAVVKGIDDFNAMPTHAAFLGVIYAVLGLILFRLAFGYDVLPLVYPILAGFILLGPFAAIALYELSRRREQGLDVSVEHLFEVFRSPSIGAITRLGLVLLAIFVAWLVAAQTMYAQIMGGAEPASFGEFASQILTTPAGHQMILVGNTVGFVFALLVLVISVVSFPMLVDRKVSVGTAVRTSVRAVAANPLTMAVWGLFVAVALVIGSLPLFFGLAVVFPVLGHATWHLYRRTVSVNEVI